MGIPYICEGTIVKTKTGRHGKVVVIDTKRKIAIIRDGKISFPEATKTLKVVSYREVE